MSYRDWHVGMKVVCVGYEGHTRSAEWWKQWREYWGIACPQRGEVYTIREMRMALDGHLRVRVDEIVNPIISFTDGPDQEPWFHALSFRPVHTKKTDISIFTAMLTGAKQTERA